MANRRNFGTGNFGGNNSNSGFNQNRNNYNLGQGLAGVSPWQSGSSPGRSGLQSGNAAVPSLLGANNLLNQLTTDSPIAIATKLLTSILPVQQNVQQPPSLMSLKNSYGSSVRYGGGSFGNDRFRRDMKRTDTFRNRRQGNDRNKDRKSGDNKTKSDKPKTKSNNEKEKGKKEDEDENEDERKEEEDKDENLDESQKEGNDKEEAPIPEYENIPTKLFHCHVCGKSMWNDVSFDTHVKGRNHRNKLRDLEENYQLQTDIMRQIAAMFPFTGILIKTTSCYEHHLRGPSFHMEPPAKVEFSNTSGSWIDCTASGNPPPTIDWIAVDGSAVDDVLSVRRVLRNGTLVLLPFGAAAYRQDIHNTVYRCIASNAVGRIISRDVQVRAVVAQAYKVSVEVLSASRGCTAVLRCVIPSFVKELVKVVSWVQDPATYLYPKLQGDGKYHVLPTGELLIHDLQLNDQYPQYRCRTMHRLTRQVVGSPPVTIRISEHRGVVSPAIIEHSGTVHVEQDEGVVMLCIAQSCPSPVYRWFTLTSPEPVLLTPGPRTHLLGPILALEAVTHEDAGVYRCSASNVGGEASAELRLVVSSPFHVEVSPSMLSVHIGGTAEFKCNIHSEGEYNRGHMISWYKDGMPLPGSGRHNSDHFILRGVTRDDRGMYQCIVRRAEGETAQASAELQLGDAPPNLLYSFIEQTLQPGPPVSLKCSAAGNPTPQIAWTLDGFPLPNNGRFVIGQYMTVHGDVISHVNISQVAVEDGGEYTCTAENRAGKVSHSARLNIYGLPYIRLIPKVTAIAGETLRLKCPVAGYPIEEIHWEQGGKILPTEIRQNVERDGTLVITSVQKENDVGVYSCWAKNKQGKSARRSAEVSVIVPPKLSSSPDKTLNVGERASLTCSVIKGDLPMSMAWLKDGRTVDAQSVTITQLDQYNSILLIESLSQEHNGNYSCYARNAAAEVSYTTQLFVNVPPIIEPFSFQDGLSEGMRTRTVCGVSQGDPPLTITWLKDGGSLPPHLGANYTTLDAYSSLLSIPSLTSSHSGDYTCVASNPAAELRYTAKLQVKVPPRWTIEPNNVVNVERNRHIIIHCQAEGVPTPTIVWKKASGGKTGDYEEIRERMYTKIFSNGSLLLQNVKEDREGVYMCQANNGIGNPIGRMVQLKVNSPPYFSTPSRQVTVKRGDVAVLQCNVNGDKPISVTWLKSGNVELTPQTNYRILVKQDLTPEGVTAEIRIDGTEATDSGTYFCQASNMYGREQQMVQLLVQEPPQTPSELEIISVSSRSVNLQWKRQPEDPAEVSKYVIQYKEGDAAGNWQNVEVGVLPSATIEDLKPDTRYTIRVIAEGAAGRSSPSLPLLIKTEPQRPAGPPLHVNVRPVSSTEILLTWSPPLAELRHGKILGYNVGLREASSSTSSYTFTNVSGDEEEEGELLLTGLSKFTRYSIVIRSFNQVGPGPLSEPILTQTLEDVPSMAPEDVICTALSPQSLQISWQPPPSSHCNGILQGYKIHVEPLYDDVWYGTDEFEPRKTTSLTIVISGLRKYTNYSVQVLAFTRVGDGIMTRPSYCQTEEDVPGPPADVKVVVKSSQSLLVSWLPPKEPNGIITKYNLYMRTDNPSATELHQNKHYLPTQHTSYEVKNLRQQVEYQFHVTASTRIGEGQSSKSVTQFPSSRVPARIASFGGPIVFPWQTSATLSCNAVGQPEPRREWFKNNQPLRVGTGSSHQILESGEIILSNLQQSDTANYTCQVDNLQGSDRIIYNLVVQVPPSAPVLYVTSATSSSILFHWKAGSSGGAAITGFILHYRKAHSDLEELLLPRRISSYELKNLSCGSTYHLYLIAQNKIGKSPQSPTLSVRTQGEAPGVPQGTTLIQPNSTSVLLRLHVWPDNGCPLLYFVIQYRANTDSLWILVSNSLKPQKRFTIPGLKPSSVYQLKIEAHNIAGSSMAEFTFITLTKDGEPPPPELVTRNHPTHSLLTDVRIVVPLLLAIAALFAALTAAAFCWRNRHLDAFGAEQARPLKETLDNQQNAEAQRERYYATIHKVALQANSEKIPETSEDISPYATFQLSEANAPTNAMLHSFMYHEQTLTKGCASPPPPSMKMSVGRRRSRSRSRSRKQAESEDSDSDVEQLTSSRTESSNQLDAARIKQNYIYHGAHSSTSSDISPMSEAKSLPRRGRNRNNSRWLASSKASLRSLLPPLSTAETSFNGLPLEPPTPDRPELSEAECDIDTMKKLKLGLRSSLWSRPSGHTNHTDYSIAV